MPAEILEFHNVDFAYDDYHQVLEDINLTVHRGKNIGLVGESGSGKSTILRLMLGLYKPTTGQILFEGSELALDNREQARHFRKNVQVVFQDPYSSLDPRQRIDRLIAEPLRSLGLDRIATESEDRKVRRQWIDQQVADTLSAVGLSPDLAMRYPSEFSGGQRQRIAIARAIVSKPRVLLADEPVSALDVATRVKVIDLLQELGENLGLTIVMVSHDLSVVAALCKQSIVLEKGSIVESGDTSEVLGNPRTPYARKLLESLPRLPR